MTVPKPANLLHFGRILHLSLQLRQTVNLLTSCPGQPLAATTTTVPTVTVPPGTLFSASLRRDSARYARIFQLQRSLIPGGRAPLRLAPSEDRSHQLFGVTEDGILYVLKPGKLRKFSGVVKVRLISRDGDKNYVDAAPVLNVTINVNITTPWEKEGGEEKAECPERRGSNYCAEESTERECVSLCGAGTQGRCSWRPPPENGVSTLMIVKVPIFGQGQKIARWGGGMEAEGAQRIREGLGWGGLFQAYFPQAGADAILGSLNIAFFSVYRGFKEDFEKCPFFIECAYNYPSDLQAQWTSFVAIHKLSILT